jgi:hypothetical protein
MAVPGLSGCNQRQFSTGLIARKPLNLSGFFAFQRIAKRLILL